MPEKNYTRYTKYFTIRSFIHFFKKSILFSNDTLISNKGDISNFTKVQYMLFF